LKRGVTAIVPAYNEAGMITDTVRSLQRQTVPPDEVIVVDDFSDDGTAGVAGGQAADTEVFRSMGWRQVTVVRPPVNTGSKAGAQNFALPLVETEFCMALDADSILSPNAIESALATFGDPEVAATCGMVAPRYVRTLWERGRYLEYLFAFSFFKPIQDYYGKPLISSGCFSLYRTKLLRDAGGWSTRTLAEDMDLTWTLYESGYKVRYVHDAACYPIEPHTFGYMWKQLRRWSHGFVQNVMLHWRGLRRLGFIRTVVGVAFADAAFASIVYLIVLPLLAVLVSPWFLLGYVIDLPAILVPILTAAWQRQELMKALSCLPAFLVLRTVNGVTMLMALFAEVVLRRSLTTYEKGH
jgi:biofilm PGA synthesis N-glycosyltransferase PgaC